MLECLERTMVTFAYSTSVHGLSPGDVVVLIFALLLGDDLKLFETCLLG